jgi:uncharacterized protein YdeI (YjbR/CyaY-like superfamily)
MVDRELIHPATRAEWRSWLAANHETSRGVLVAQWRAHTGRQQVTYDDLVEEALCFGWIDSTYRVVDDERSSIQMTPRRPDGPWARSNKDRVERLVAAGLMAEAGQRIIDTAKANGAWTVLDDVDALVVPDDLAAALAVRPGARERWDAFPPSVRKQALYSLKTAKRAETRQRRVDTIAEKSEQNIRPA